MIDPRAIAAHDRFRAKLDEKKTIEHIGLIKDNKEQTWQLGNGQTLSQFTDEMLLLHNEEDMGFRFLYDDFGEVNRVWCILLTW